MILHKGKHFFRYCDIDATSTSSHYFGWGKVDSILPNKVDMLAIHVMWFKGQNASHKDIIDEIWYFYEVVEDLVNNYGGDDCVVERGEFVRILQ